MNPNETAGRRRLVQRSGPGADDRGHRARHALRHGHLRPHHRARPRRGAGRGRPRGDPARPQGHRGLPREGRRPTNEGAARRRGHARLLRHYRGRQGPSLRGRRGEIVCLIGANGAGKTTTLRTLSGLSGPRGAIFYEGRRIDGLPAHDIVRLGLAQSPEGPPGVPPHDRAENLDMGAFIRRDRGSARTWTAIYELFPILRERARQAAGTLSGGEQQMLAMGRALMARPASCCWTSRRWGWPPSSCSASSTSSARSAAGHHHPPRRAERRGALRWPTAATCSRPAGSCSRTTAAALLARRAGPEPTSARSRPPARPMGRVGLGRVGGRGQQRAPHPAVGYPPVRGPNIRGGGEACPVGGASAVEVAAAAVVGDACPARVREPLAPFAHLPRVRAFSTRSSDPRAGRTSGPPWGPRLTGTLTAGRAGVNRLNPLCRNGFSIVAGGTCDDEFAAVGAVSSHLARPGDVLRGTSLARSRHPYRS